MTRRQRLLLLSISLSFISSTSFASINAPAKPGWFLGALAGSTNSNLSNGNSHIQNGSGFTPPSDTDLYTVKNPGTAHDWGVYAGHLWLRQTRFIPFFTVAVRYQHLNGSNVNGVIEQYSLPAFENYNYNVHLTSNIFNLIGKANLFQVGYLAPYLSGGIGYALNRISNYNETALPGVIPRISPDYQNATNNNFMYNVGIGVDIYFCPKLWASLGYEYANLGPISTNNGTNDWSGQHLSFGNWTTSTGFLSLSYLLPA